MAAGRSTNTMSEGLYKTLATIAQMATAPDADLQFLTKLQVDITQFLRGPQAGAPTGGQPGQPQGQPGMPPPGNSGGAMQGLGMSGGPNMDEISRILGGAGGGGNAGGMA